MHPFGTCSSAQRCELVAAALVGVLDHQVGDLVRDREREADHEHQRSDGGAVRPPPHAEGARDDVRAQDEAWELRLAGHQDGRREQERRARHQEAVRPSAVDLEHQVDDHSHARRVLGPAEHALHGFLTFLDGTC